MTGKKWLIILGIINVLAIAGIVFWYVNRDNTPPVISWEGEIIYEDTMSDEELLQGVTALDGNDGDVSHTLVVEKVTINQKTGIATITYGATDNSGNIAKQSVQVEAKITQPVLQEEQVMESTSGEVFSLEAGEAVIDAQVRMRTPMK